MALEQHEVPLSPHGDRGVSRPCRIADYCSLRMHDQDFQALPLPCAAEQGTCKCFNKPGCADVLTAPLQHHAEYLEDKLASFPTTVAEDEKLLANKKLSWLDRRVIEFRRERKLSMQLGIKRIREQAKTAYSLLQMSEVEENHKFGHSEL